MVLSSDTFLSEIKIFQKFLPCGKLKKRVYNNLLKYW